MNHQYDVIVIGAGFGGPVAGKICADAGLKTLLIERSEKAGEKVISGLTIPFYGFLFGPSFIREGNPPIERPADGIINYIIKDIENADIEIDDSLKIPKPLSPIIAFGYNAYCQPFCQWETDRAIESGVEFLRSTTVTELIKEEDFIKGLITDKGERYYSKIIIDAEGSQGLLAVKAGIREKYPPEAISLADTYDYHIPKNLVDQIFGFSVRFCWGWDEQKIAPPLGYGNGLMVWPYRESIHFIQDQCLKLNNNRVPNLSKMFKIYHKNITTKLEWWREKVIPNSKLRAKMFQGFEIFVGLNKELRNFPNYTNGMILIGDAAGLESTELCDGVPCAWFSAEIAANVAIDSIKANDYSKNFLNKYDTQIRNHPIIQWCISGTHRHDLRFAQQKHDLNLLRQLIHEGWGLAALTHFTTPLIKAVVIAIKKDPSIMRSWINMFFRYFQNWLYNDFNTNFSKVRIKIIAKNRNKNHEMFYRMLLFTTDFFLKVSKMLYILFHRFLFPSSEILNQLVKRLLPKIESPYNKLITLFHPFLQHISQKLIKFTLYANPYLFIEFRNGGKNIEH